MKTFEIGELEDFSGFAIDTAVACVHFDKGEWFFDGLEGNAVKISKSLALMMIREIAEEETVLDLEHFLKGEI